MRPELNRAAAMLFRSGVVHPTSSDSELLATDIMELAGELAGEQGNPAFYVGDAARELEKRIGGIDKLALYMKQLRAAVVSMSTRH